MFIRRVSILTAIIISLSSTIAIAQSKLPASPKNQPGGWLQELNLTPQQFQQIKQIRRQSQPLIAEKARLVRQGQQELHDLLAGTAPQAQVQEKYRQIQQLKQQLADAQFANTLAIREILNSQQRQKLANRLYKPQGN